MKTYLIVVKTMIPYPVEKKYTESASKMSVAVKRALDKHWPVISGKSIKNIKIDVIWL